MYSTDGVSEKRLLLEDVYKKHHDALCFYACRYMSSYSDAEDVVHSVFEKLMVKKILPNNEEAICSYIYSSVHNECLNTLSHNNVVQKNIGKMVEKGKEVNSTLEYIDSRIESDFLWEVFNGIERLPKQCSSILKLSYLEGKNNAEIADFMGISINTVKSQKARAKLLLREYLKNIFE